jgi:hypothetical protein
MTQEREPQPQDAVLEGLELDGASQSPQAEPEPEGHQQGAEQQSGRTYTQAEWSARESAKDKEISETRRQLLTLAQQVEQDRVEQMELGYRTADARAVDDGEITQSEAAQRQQLRYSDARDQATRTRERTAHQQMMVEGEAWARFRVAEELAKQFGVDAKVLTEDQSLQSGPAMEMKARELALDKREAELKGTETYDAGQPGGRPGVGFDSMSPEDKIGWALDHPPKPR